MGWGNFLIKSKSLCHLTNTVEAMGKVYDAWKAVPLRVTPDGLFMAVVGVDCGFVKECDTCHKPQCVGCGMAIIADADVLDIGIICMDCYGGTLWAAIEAAYMAQSGDEWAMPGRLN